MYLIEPTLQRYAWGSKRAIPRMLGTSVDGKPVAEAWYGAHHSAPSTLANRTGHTLLDLLNKEPNRLLGDDVVSRFGPQLPYLMKIISAGAPLSLQVHPTIELAQQEYEAENAAGIGLDEPHRNYKDQNHKPELVLALTNFQALSGFRAPRRVLEVLKGLNAPLAEELRTIVAAQPTAAGIRAAFEFLLRAETRPTQEEISAVVDACSRRMLGRSPSRRADAIVARLAKHYPGDPGVVTSLLLNPVTLKEGEVMFVPAGSVHAYLSGTAIEVMSNSNNVLRAGLTPKHVDVPQLVKATDWVAAPPLRIAPEKFDDGRRVFYAPVEDFELSVTRVRLGRMRPLAGRGPRVVLCLDGQVELMSRSSALRIRRGQAAFVGADEGELSVRGRGSVVQSDVP